MNLTRFGEPETETPGIFCRAFFCFVAQAKCSSRGGKGPRMNQRHETRCRPTWLVPTLFGSDELSTV